MLGVRGAKRDITYACTTLCASRSCLQFLKTTEIEMLDTSSCLHLDNVSSISLNPLKLKIKQAEESISCVISICSAIRRSS